MKLREPLSSLLIRTVFNCLDARCRAEIGRRPRMSLVYPFTFAIVFWSFHSRHSRHIYKTLGIYYRNRLDLQNSSWKEKRKKDTRYYALAAFGIFIRKISHSFFSSLSFVNDYVYLFIFIFFFVFIFTFIESLLLGRKNRLLCVSLFCSTFLYILFFLYSFFLFIPLLSSIFPRVCIRVLYCVYVYFAYFVRVLCRGSSVWSCMCMYDVNIWYLFARAYADCVHWL